MCVPSSTACYIGLLGSESSYSVNTPVGLHIYIENGNVHSISVFMLVTEKQQNNPKSTKGNQNITVRNAYAREDTLPIIHIPGPTFLLAGDNSHAFPNNVIVTSHGQIEVHSFPSWGLFCLCLQTSCWYITMGANSAPLLPNLYNFYHEYHFLNHLA